MFLGDSGIGKYLTAVNFAKTMNCQKVKLDSCDSCVSCSKVDNLNHPDVIIVNKKADRSTIGIDDIRQLHVNINLKCYESDRKICIIRDAENMTSQAQNALLKNLEDMPLQIVVILIVSQLNDIFPTVISRCKVIRFSPLNHDIMTRILSKEADKSVGEIEYVGHFSGGSLEKAFDFLNDDLLQQRDDLINLMCDNKKRLLFYEPKYKSRQDVLCMLDIMISWYRDLILIINDMQDLIVNKDKIDVLKSVCGDNDLSKLTEIIENIISTKKDISNNANVKLSMHNNMVEICKLEGVI